MTRNNVRNSPMTQKRYRATQPYGGIDARERKAARRETFVEAGLEAFGTIGYARSTIADICKEAGLTQRYFYESFKDKEALLVAVYRKLIGDIEEDARIIFDQPDISLDDKGRKMLQTFYQRFKDNPRRAQVQLFEVLGVSPLVDSEYRAGMIKLSDWCKIIANTIFPEFPSPHGEQTVIFTGMAGAIIQIAHQWVLDGMKMEVEEIVDQISNMLFTLGKYYTDRF